jgi:hypothetical protein
MMQRRTFIEGVGALSLSSAVFVDRARAQSGVQIVVKGVYAAPGLSFAAIFIRRDVA